MRVLILAFLALCVVAPGQGKGRSIQKTTGKKLKGCYGVQFRKDATDDSKLQSKNKAGGRRDREWSSGFQVCGVSEARAQSLLESDDVESVFEDGIVYKNEATNVWGLDRIDAAVGEAPLDGSYHTAGAQGEGVTAYVLDTCGDASHSDFGGRATFVHDEYPNDDLTGSCCSHGTHCMGTIGGNTYGVAKKVTLKSVRVLGCSGGTITSVVSGIDWVRVNHNPSEGRAIISMSLGGSGNFDAMVNAIDNARASGIPVVVAAGNENTDACTRSPAHVPRAITVAASDISDNLASYSNWGSCVDIVAPGTNVCSTYPDQQTNCISGTSMATPHVAGAMALILSAWPELTPEAAEAALIAAATPSIDNSKPSQTTLLLNVATFASSCEVDNCLQCADTAICEACPVGYALKSNACVPCSVANCASCNTDSSVCTTCLDSYILSNNECFQCPANCAVCASSSSCSQCATGYFANSNGDCVAICESRANSNLDSIVQSLSFAGLDFNHLSCSTYQSLSASSATVKAGEVYPMSLLQGTCSGDYSKISGVWIDWDGDGIFESNEKVLSGVYQRPSITVSRDVTVPADAFVGIVNARAIVTESSIVSACGNYNYGETVDFTVIVEAAEPPCSLDSECSASNVCQTVSCQDGKCVETAIADCCLSAGDCQNADICTATSCVDNVCIENSIEGCCKAFSDCPASTDPCFEATCQTNNCIETRICDCCEVASDCDDNDATTVDECKLDGAVGQCYNTPVDCDHELNGQCWFLAVAEQSCEAKCVAEGRVVSSVTTSFAGSSGTDANCLAVAQLFDTTATFDRTSAHSRGCVLGSNGIIRGTRDTLDDASCSSEQRFCACDSVSKTSGQTLALVGGGVALVLGGLLGGVMIQKKRERVSAQEVPTLE